MEAPRPISPTPATPIPTPGVFVSAILAKPDISTPAKYASVYTEQGPFKVYLQASIEVTGRRAPYVQVSQEQFEAIWG